MNKSYKVVFSKARGALMVVNEATSSVQAKGAKTVIAVAAALVAGSAMAADAASVIPTVPEDAEVTAPADGNFADQNYKYSADGQGAFYGPAASGTFDKNLWVVADAATDNLSGFWATGEGTVFTNEGNIYVDGSAEGVASYKQHALSADNGAKVVNKGLIAAVNGYGMTTGTKGAGATIVNENEIVIDREGVGMELGGMAGAKGENNGTITVTKGEGDAFAVGALIKGTSGNTFTNNGAIVANGDAARAISVEQDDSKTVSNTVILGAGSKITGNIYVEDGTQTTLKLDGMQDTLSFEKESAVDKLEVVNGAQATIADAVESKTGGTTFKDVAITNGTLTASIFQENNKFTKVTVGEDGLFNITALNSNFNAALGNQAPSDADKTTKDSYLLLNELVLNGGNLAVNSAAIDKIKVGSDGTTGALHIQKGDYGFGAMLVGGKGTAKIDEGSSLTVDNLYLTNYDARITNAGTLTVDAVTMAKGADGKDIVPTADAQNDLIINTGAIYTAASNVLTFTKDDAGKITDAAETAFGSVLFDTNDTGKVYDASITDITVSEYKAIFGQDDAWGDHLFLTNATVTADTPDGTVGFGDLTAGGSLGNTVVTSNTATAAPVSDVTVASVAFTGDASKGDVTVGDGTSGHVLGLTGKDGTFVSGVAADKTITFTGKVNLGDAQSTAQNAIANDVVVATGAELGIEGNLTTQHIVNNGTMKIGQGVVEAGSISNGNVTIQGGAVIVKGQSKPEAPVALADPAAPAYDSAFVVESNYKVRSTDGKTGFLYFGTGSSDVIQSVADTAKAAYGASVKSILYVDQHIDLATSDKSIQLGIGNKGEHQNAKAGAGQIKVNGNSVVVLNTSALADHNYNPVEAVITAEAGSSISNLLLTDLDRDAFEQGTDGSFTLNVGVQANDVQMLADFYEVNSDDQGVITVKADEAALTELKTDGVYVSGEVAQSVRTMTAGNALVNAVIYGNAANDAYWAPIDAQIEELEKLIAKTTDADERAALLARRDAIEAAADAYDIRSINAVANMAVESGAFSTAVDVNDQVMGALTRRTSLANLNVSRAQSGFTPWVDVIGSTNEAKGLYGSAGYEADIYGAVLGFDYTASCGGVLGLAFNIGTADANSVDSDVKSDSDTDFYGVSLYAAKQMGLVNVQAALGYQQTSNDLSTSGSLGQWKESLDADLFTFGLGAEYLAKAGAVNVVPHAGIRWTRIEMDDSKFGADYDTMNLFQMPIGVAFSGEFETAGVKLAPMFDLSVVPTFGDKDATANFVEQTIDTRVVDSNPVRATLGLNGQIEAWTFGVNYGLSAGSDERLNNSFNVNARYTF